MVREINKRIRDPLCAGPVDRRTLFLCECETDGCVGTVELTLEEFEAIRWRGHVHVVSVGHERPDAERIIEATPRFVLVERRAEARLRAKSP